MKEYVFPQTSNLESLKANCLKESTPQTLSEVLLEPQTERVLESGKTTSKGVMVMKRIIVVLAIIASGLLISCASQNSNIGETKTLAPQPLSSQPPAPYLIQPGDQLDIKFFYNPELNEAVTVRPDGKISLQLIDEIQAAGRSPAELDKILTKDYSAELKKPAVTVIVKSFTSQRVYVGGEVNRQGLIDLRAGMTPLQAVLNSGGFKETAMPEGAIIIRKGPENQPVPIRVDLKGALYGNGSAANLPLQPYDVVYVPKSAIAKANKFVQQYIENLLLFRGVSLGFSYELHSDSNNNR